MHVDTALAMQALSGAPRFAAAIAQESGGVFVPLPEIEMAGREELFDKQQELLAELGELFARFREFTADNELDARESAKLRHLVDEVHRGLQEFMAVALQLYARHHAGPGEHQ